MRHITQAGIDLIKRFEGLSPTVYICPAGYPTIGYGHVVKPHERQQFASGITTEQAEELLRQDVQIAERAVLRLITVPLTDGQFDALVSFTFNLGAGALQRSTLRRKVNVGIMLLCQQNSGNGCGLGDESWRGWSDGETLKLLSTQHPLFFFPDTFEWLVISLLIHETSCVRIAFRPCIIFWIMNL